MGKGGEQDPVGIFEELDDALSRRAGVTVLVFFSPDCYSCFDDLFEMKHLLDENGWPASVVGIASGLRGDLEFFIDKYDWSLPIVWDRKRRIFRRFGVGSAPFKMLLIDGDVIYQDDPNSPFPISSYDSPCFSPALLDLVELRPPQEVIRRSHVFLACQRHQAYTGLVAYLEM